MERFYQLIHQRAPLAEVLDALSKAESIVPEELTVEFELVRSRNPFYAKKLVKALSENTHLFDEDANRNLSVVHRPTLNQEPIELNEWVFEQYVEFLSVGAPSPMFKDIIRYTFSRNLAVDVQEQPLLLCASGTTGFRTWEAALFLAEFLAQSPPALEDISHKHRVLELGAGTGLVSIAWAKLHGSQTKKLYVTDGDSTLVEQSARNNFALNGLDTAQDKYIFRRLWWGEDEIPDVDLILAADVTYDTSVIPHLVECLVTALVHQNSGNFALIAATVRNEETVAAFESCCSLRGLDFSIIAEKPIDPAPIRIYKIQHH
ncbi:LADA_0A07734g1_1 [Lachancea dasiensis]|uniref:LADA_0A07734g1_1 n=1 Tax=Lachancea dasiensis TaxID=1072105 RepID=A0A1G4IQK0_9SACH|nr:LADA_0A07734g1_1 [Lachancea dasiensis]